MAKQTAKLQASVSDLNGPDALMRFKKLAGEFNKKHNSTREAALSLLKKEGIATPSGKLSKRYSG